MPRTIHSVTINNLSDLEAVCKRWRELGATDDSVVTINGDFGLDVVGRLMEHHTSNRMSISLELFEA